MSEPSVSLPKRPPLNTKALSKVPFLSSIVIESFNCTPMLVDSLLIEKEQPQVVCTPYQQ